MIIISYWKLNIFPLKALIRSVLNIKHTRMSAHLVHILGCSTSSISKLLQFEHVHACSILELWCLPTPSIDLYFIDDHCQHWLNKTDGTLTSPNYGVNDLGYIQRYDQNLNCTWILNADQESYISIEIESFKVNDNDTNGIYFCNFSNKLHQSSLLQVTISQSMTDQISNHHQYQNWMNIPIIIKKVFQVQDITWRFNLWQIMIWFQMDS